MRKAHIALLTVGVIYGLNYYVAKGLMPDLIGPSGFITLRVLGGGLMFWVILMMVGRQKIDRGDWGRLAICGLTGVAINQLCFFNGLALTSPVHASLIMTINPIFVLMASSFLLGSKVTGRKLTGVVLGGIGAATLLLLGSSNEVTDNGASIGGDVLILINALSYGVYLVVVKPLMTKYKPLTVIAWVFFFGAVFAVPFGVGEVMEIKWNAFEIEHWQGIVFVIVGTTFFAYLLNVYALGIVESTVVSIYIYLQPLIVMLVLGGLVYMGLRENERDLNIETAISALAIFTGVWLVSIPKGWLSSRSKA